MNNAIYQQLQVVAKSKECTYYSDIAPLANLDMKNVGDRDQMADILGEISSHEHRQGRPMLSAVVISIEGNKPGVGFFGLAGDLGLYDGHDDDKFWFEELNRVWEHWG